MTRYKNSVSDLLEEAHNALMNKDYEKCIRSYYEVRNGFDGTPEQHEELDVYRSMVFRALLDLGVKNNTDPTADILEIVSELNDRYRSKPDVMMAIAKTCIAYDVKECIAPLEAEDREFRAVQFRFAKELNNFNAMLKSEHDFNALPPKPEEYQIVIDSKIPDLPIRMIYALPSEFHMEEINADNKRINFTVIDGEKSVYGSLPMPNNVLSEGGELILKFKENEISREIPKYIIKSFYDHSPYGVIIEGADFTVRINNSMIHQKRA